MSGKQQHSQGHPKKGKPKLRVIPAPADGNAPDFGPADQEYFRALHRLIDQIFSEAADHFEWTWAKLASHANLSYPTVVNLGERQTKYPRFQTVYKLAHAVGWKLVLETVKRQKKASTAKMAVG